MKDLNIFYTDKSFKWKYLCVFMPHQYQIIRLIIYYYNYSVVIP